MKPINYVKQLVVAFLVTHKQVIIVQNVTGKYYKINVNSLQFVIFSFYYKNNEKL